MDALSAIAATDVLDELDRRGTWPTWDGHHLRIRADKGAITPELREGIKATRPELVALVQKRAQTPFLQRVAGWPLVLREVWIEEQVRLQREHGCGMMAAAFAAYTRLVMGRLDLPELELDAGPSATDHDALPVAMVTWVYIREPKRRPSKPARARTSRPAPKKATPRKTITTRKPKPQLRLGGLK